MQAAAKAIIEGDQVLYDGVELFTAIMLADQHDANHRAVEMAVALHRAAKIAADLEVNPAPQKPSA